MEIGNTPAKRSMVDDKRSMADCGRLNQMTPPTAPDLLARERSPRRLVLTKRALMVGGRVGTERAARRVASRPGAASKCQCYTQPTVCTVCMARCVHRCLSVCRSLSMTLFVCHFLSICLSLFLSICLSHFPSVCLTSGQSPHRLCQRFTKHSIMIARFWKMITLVWHFCMTSLVFK